MNKFIFKIILFLLFSINILFSQVKFSIGPTVGFTAPVGDYGGTTYDYFNGTRYGLSGGINFGGVFKAKFTSVSARLSVIYSSLKNTGGSEPGDDGYIETKQSILMIALGPEFSFALKSSSVQPYVGVDFLLTSFSGETIFLNVGKGVSNRTVSMASTSRAGVGLGGGVLFGLGKKYTLDIGVKYNMHNLFGKSFSVYDTEGPRYLAYASLNDDRDPVYPNEINDHPIGNSRSISTIMINAAFLFDF